MCLASIDSTPIKTKIGYKIFVKTYGGLKGEFCYSTNIRPLNIWIHADNYAPEKLINTIKGSYLTGWHVFRYLKDAKIWNKVNVSDSNHTIYKVKIKEITYTGSQYTVGNTKVKVIVCKQIFIMGEVTQKRVK